MTNEYEFVQKKTIWVEDVADDLSTTLVRFNILSIDKLSESINFQVALERYWNERIFNLGKDSNH